MIVYDATLWSGQPPTTQPDQDPGDEDAPGSPVNWKFITGTVVCIWPRRWREEPVPAPPEHDPGDEDDHAWWVPLSELSWQRLYEEMDL